MLQLRGQPWQAAEPSVPAPLSFVPELGLILQECVEGADLRCAVAGATESPFELAARWLGRLHDASPVAGLKERSLDHELARIDGWQAEIAPQLPPDAARRLHDARERWREFARELAPPERVMIHKDYYLAHVLWDGRGVWVVDFDELAVGDPAFDVGHFLAHLEYHAQRTSAEVAPWSEAAARFRAAYPAAGRSFDARLRFYAAYTFLKLAATVLRRRREGWAGLAASLAASACREAECLPRGSGERE
jgi:aminoglycoside phosphotransferase (APT) family kinase protein